MIEYENLKKVNERFFKELDLAATEIIHKGWYVLGESVANFEKDFANWNGNLFCIGTANGLDALTLSLIALELPPKSEIIVPSNTYIATILAIIHSGHVPVLVEPDIRTYNIDPKKLVSKITPKTKAVLVVHLYGLLCDMKSIIEICNTNGLFLLEDCAQSHGAQLEGKKAGCFGILNAFSFYPTKNLGALGDAGAIVTNDVILAERVRSLRNYGSKIKYQNEYLGFNSRLDEIQAAFLSIKLKSLDELNQHKKKLASIYRNEIRNPKVILPSESSWDANVYHIFPIRCKQRDELKEYLLNHEIKTEIHYPVPPHMQKALSDFTKKFNWDYIDGFPISEEIHKTELSLPISFSHTSEDVLEVSKIINSF